MATAVDVMPEAFDGRTKKSGISWVDRYMDGQVWRLVRGEDFFCSVSGAKTYISRRSKQRGCSCRFSSKWTEPDVLYVQTFDKSSAT